MKELIILALLGFISVLLTVIAIHLLVKDFKTNLKSKRLLLTTLFVIVFSLVGTYAFALFFKNFKIVDQVGSADAWIGFSGAAMGGLITMLALYFTLKQNQEMTQKQHAVSLKPYVSCHIVNLDKEEMKIKIDKYIEDYGFIECKMKNISNNIANGVKIVDEYSLVERTKGVEERFDDLFDLCGISIFTVSMNEGTFLAPQDEHNWKTNFCVELNEDGTYKWDGSAFCFKHLIVFELSDAENIQTYRHTFQFELNINVDINDKLHFFLWNINNSITPSDTKASNASGKSR